MANAGTNREYHREIGFLPAGNAKFTSVLAERLAGRFSSPGASAAGVLTTRVSDAAALVLFLCPYLHQFPLCAPILSEPRLRGYSAALQIIISQVASARAAVSCLSDRRHRIFPIFHVASDRAGCILAFSLAIVYGDFMLIALLINA